MYVPRNPAYDVDGVACDGKQVSVTVTATVTFDESSYVEHWTFPEGECEVTLDGSVDATDTELTLEDVMVTCTDALGSNIDKGSKAMAEHVAGPDGDNRGLSDRLADRGTRVDAYMDEALTGVLSEENADTAGDLLGGVATVGSLFVGAGHYDLVDSMTGGGLREVTDDAMDSASGLWDSMF